MELGKFLQSFYDYSQKASDITRQLGFAGLAAIWIFKGTREGEPTVPHEFFLPGTLIIMGLACDLMQYVAGSIIWSAFYSARERRGFKSSDETMAPIWLNRPIYIFFYTKIILISSSYYFLLRFMLERF